MTIRLELQRKQHLDRLAGAPQRLKYLLAVEALRDFVELNEWSD
jgi:predicted transcriptional regulator